MTDAVLLNISDMIDLAIGTPEVGVVDFNMLQTVLHCLAQQLRVQSKNVEVRGSFTLPVGRENVQTVAITEYIVDTDDKSPEKIKKTDQQTADHRAATSRGKQAYGLRNVKRLPHCINARNTTSIALAPPPLLTQQLLRSLRQAYSLAGTQQSSREMFFGCMVPIQQEHSGKETILVAERIKKSDLLGTAASSPPRALSPFPHVSPSAERVPGPVYPGHAALSRLTSNEKLSLVTLSKFNFLENVVEDLKNRVYGSMPKNEAILEEVRSQTNLKAITDMWTSLNVSSRLEAAETGIAKLSSLVQDLINETAQLPEALKRKVSGTVAALPPVLASTAVAPSATSTSPPLTLVASSAQPLASAPAASPGASNEELAALQELISGLRTDLDYLSSTFYNTIEEIQGVLDKPIPLPQPPPPPTLSETIAAAKGAATAVGLTPGMTTTAEKMTAAETMAMGGATAEAALRPPSSDRRHDLGSATTSTVDLMQRINELEKKIKKCCDSIGKNDGALHEQMNSFQDQLENVMKQLSTLHQNLSGGSLSPDLIKDLQGLMALFKTVQDMQEQLKEVHDTALQLAAEKEDRQTNMNVLLEQIELLKTIKLDREDMLEAMAEKADLRMLARKVSHDQFELACDDLSRGLEHAVGKLNLQEALWQQALDDIQREIETKLDKMELSPVKDFFNNKLRQLQDNLKKMASLRREVEAYGTKQRLLRDVNCISCDANAVMNMEAQSTIPVSKPMPASHSMKPYLSYELDAIRKTQASNLPQRNMHDWENIDKQMSSKPPQKTRSDMDKHICNRYCGGSHTVTTPAQRVARLGHFIKQWGPEVLPLSSGLAVGEDGRMYKVSPVEAADVGPAGTVAAPCTPRPMPVKPELPKGHKPLITSAECHCLEGR